MRRIIEPVIMGRPRIEVSKDDIVNAYKKYHSIRKAAKYLGISPATFQRRLNELGLSRAKWVVPDWVTK